MQIAFKYLFKGGGSMERAYLAKTEFTSQEIANLINELEDLAARLDWLQGIPKLPENQKLELAHSLCQLASQCAAIAGNLIA